MNIKKSIVIIFCLLSSNFALSTPMAKIRLRNGSGYDIIDKVVFIQTDPSTRKETAFNIRNVTKPVIKDIPQLPGEYISNIEVIVGNEGVNTPGKWSGNKRFVINTDLSVSESGI
jgi:hypothetical protein